MAVSFTLDGTFSGFTGGVTVIKEGKSYNLDKIQLENGTVVWKKIEWKRIPKPEIQTRVWNGKEQYGFDKGKGYTVSGAGKDAGPYTSYATLEDGYAWEGTDDRSPYSARFEIKHLAVSKTSLASAREELINGYPTAIFSFIPLTTSKWGSVINLTRDGEQWRKYYPSMKDGVRTKATMVAQNGTGLAWSRTTAAYYSYDGSKMTVYCPFENTSPDESDIITCTSCTPFDSADVLVATVPTAATGLKYNGKEQIGVISTNGYGVTSGGSGIDAKDYEAVCLIEDVYFWPDGTTKTSNPTKTVNWSISKANWTSMEMCRIGGNLGIVVYGSDVYNRRGTKFSDISYKIYWGTSTKAGVTLAAAGVSKGTTTNGIGHLPETTDSGNLYIDTRIPMSQTFTYKGTKRKLSDCYVRAEGVAHAATTNWETFNFSIPQGQAVKV